MESISDTDYECTVIGDQYLDKYKELKNLIDGYKKENPSNQNLETLTKIIDNSKNTLLDEPKIINMKNEQEKLMKEFNYLQGLKNKSPYSPEAKEFLETSKLPPIETIENELEKQKDAKSQPKKNISELIKEKFSIGGLDNLTKIKKKEEKQKTLESSKTVDPYPEFYPTTIPQIYENIPSSQQPQQFPIQQGGVIRQQNNRQQYYTPNYYKDPYQQPYSNNGISPFSMLGMPNIQIVNVDKGDSEKSNSEKSIQSSKKMTEEKSNVSLKEKIEGYLDNVMPQGTKKYLSKKNNKRYGKLSRKL